MGWRNGSTIEIYRRRRPPMGAILKAAWHIVQFQSGPRIIADLLAWAPAKGAEQESGGV